MNKLLITSSVALLLIAGGCGTKNTTPEVNATPETTLNETASEDNATGFKIEKDVTPAVVKETYYLDPALIEEFTKTTGAKEPDPLIYVSAFELDENGKITTEKQYYREIADEELGSTITYKYDENGYLTEKEFKSEMSGKTTLENTVDENGRLISFESNTSYDDGSEIYYKEEYTYDRNENLAIVTNVQGKEDPTTTTTEYTYDQYGNVIKEKIDNNGQKSVVSYEYDFSNPNEVVSNVTVQGDKTTHAKYIYFIKDNKLSKIEYYNEISKNNKDGSLYLESVKEFTY